VQTHERPQLLDAASCFQRRSAARASRAELARVALVDRTTVYRLERGDDVGDLSRRRIEAALEQLEETAA
jgi:DNA-binding XRE family transcriptional regulator